ncbi:hypothetical protein [Priestia endophytica]|jgi:hypothetical protein|uniref:Uncharacterized protein n=1 Tax=Priestia endophytica TaxID=135735 RepID=A0AAX1Q9K9_9BACI|nr:hypothetical protein [Priestia endophytica]KAB2495665.1 hypothetical protein F8155_06730 [Priestia endophytica]KYG36233.1 hypothetical protein AZF06_03285 [Priestia endophytica]MBG9815171.1 hypothetical protein [Priestia endophytica]MCM3539780.1 hypothetical protein [Priestia endophytica]RAS77796.1 hypothetical protein A3864_10835 [Priestia endophytica]
MDKQKIENIIIELKKEFNIKNNELTEREKDLIHARMIGLITEKEMKKRILKIYGIPICDV